MKSSPHFTGGRHYQRSLNFPAEAGGRCHLWPGSKSQTSSDLVRPIQVRGEGVLSSLPESTYLTYPSSPGLKGLFLPTSPRLSLGYPIRNGFKELKSGLAYTSWKPRLYGGGSGSHPQQKQEALMPSTPPTPPPPLPRVTAMPPALVPIPAHLKSGFALHLEKLPTPALWENALGHHIPRAALLPFSLPPQSPPPRSVSPVPAL